MLSKSTLQAGVFALALVQSVALQAATLDSINGDIFVSQGAGYRAVYTPTELLAGDSVLANPNSSARVVFEDGCAVSIHPGMVFTVPETSPCRAGLSFFGHEISWPLVAGGVAVAAGVGIAIAVSDDDDDRRIIPFSP